MRVRAKPISTYRRELPGYHVAYLWRAIGNIRLLQLSVRMQP
ncbi:MULTISPECIES: hypothetical protein [unclassified Microcoleus]